MTRWLRLVVAVAMLKNVAAIGVAVASGVRMAPPLVYSPDQYALLILAFSATGIVLIAAHTRDERAVWLGCILLLTAAPFAETLLGVSASLNPSLASIARLLERTPVVPLLAVFCWLFVRHFPDDISSGIGKRVSHAGIRTSLAMALLLVASNLSESVWPISLDASPDFRARISRQSHQSFYWPIIIAAALPAFAFLAWRTQSAGLAERRRVRIFVAGLLMGFVPISLTVLLEAVSPAYGRLVTGSDAGYWIAQIVFLSLAAVPLVTAYSVMVDRVVEIRLVIRSALQYALAKYTLLAIVTVPLAGMIWYLYRYRDRTLLQILSGSGLLLLGITALIAGVLLLTRTRALRALDRRFFREQYDARHILNDLADRCRKAPTVDDLVALVCRDVDRALHLDYVTVLLATPGGGVLRSPDGRIPPLSESSGLAVLAKGDRTPLLVDLKNDPTLRRLPDEERNWLVESGFGLLVPLNAADGSLQGLVGLGHKLSELPFSREDRLLLEAIGASVALTIENRRLRDSASSQKQGRLSTLPPERRPDDGRPATECDACGRVYPADATVCDCGSELEPSLVPYVLSGKFQLDRRLGRGGMGVVYRALDLDLGRHVAIKTLPHMGPDEAARLRREAKAMAAVQHENLAMIFGAETWFGMPILVVELLAGGTLAARLRSGPVPFAQALEIGIALSRGVEHLHHAGVLHCDIKPSNIGFTRHDVPKLLDFGLATIRRPATGNTTTRSSSGFDRSAGVTPVGAADGVPFEGTPRYMSPEALAGQPPQRASDIWSLTVVLFEMMAGTPPFGGASFAAIGGAVLQGAPPDIRAACPTCPPAIASFFARALSRSGERPRTAVHLGVELVRLRDDLTMQ